MLLVVILFKNPLFLIIVVFMQLIISAIFKQIFADKIRILLINNKNMNYLTILYNSLLKTTFFLLISIFIFSVSCVKWDPKNARENPTNSTERAKKNVAEGRGASIGGLFGKGSTNYEFSTSNPMWRASLEVLDFLPLSVVDYSGGMLITDWYSDELGSGSSLKITLRFLSNEVQSNSLKIIVHQKNCSSVNACTVKILNSKIKEELLTSIIRKAAVLEKEAKTKK